MYSQECASAIDNAKNARDQEAKRKEHQDAMKAKLAERAAK